MRLHYKKIRLYSNGLCRSRIYGNVTTVLENVTCKSCLCILNNRWINKARQDRIFRQFAKVKRQDNDDIVTKANRKKQLACT